jgi:hypothetical protein
MAEVVTSDATSKWVDVIVQIIRATQEGELRWEAKPSSASSPPLPGEDATPSVYEATYKGRRIRLYQTTLPRRGYYNTPYRRAVILELFDPGGVVPWQFPDLSILRDLYDAVAFRIAGVQEFVKDVLQES